MKMNPFLSTVGISHNFHVPSPIKYFDESKAKLATEMTEQERLEIEAIKGKGIDFIVRSSLNKVFPLKEVANDHYARVK